MDELDGVEIMAFADAAAFEGWLAEHHPRHEGVWIKVAKKKSGIATVAEDEMVDIGLYGWISGQRRSFDEQHYLQKYVPRRPRSVWSQVNVDKVCALALGGQPSGLVRPGTAPTAPWPGRAQTNRFAEAATELAVTSAPVACSSPEPTGCHRPDRPALVVAGRRRPSAHAGPTAPEDSCRSLPPRSQRSPIA